MPGSISSDAPYFNYRFKIASNIIPFGNFPIEHCFFSHQDRSRNYQLIVDSQNHQNVIVASWTTQGIKLIEFYPANPDAPEIEDCPPELEARISALEIALELLQASFNAHTNQEIPTAHNYDSNLKINGSYFNEILNLTVADNQSSDSVNIPIPLPEIPEFQINNVDVDVFESNGQYTITVAVENVSDSDTFTINIPEPIPSTIGISGSCENGGINLTVSDGQSVDTTWIDLCMSECDLTEIIDLLNEIKNELTIEISDNLEGNLTCGFGIENPLINDPLRIKATANKTPKNYSGKTFLAINQALQLINKNIVANFEEICKLYQITKCLLCIMHQQ